MKTLLSIAAVLLSLALTAQPGEKKSVVIGSMTTRPNALLIINPQNSDQGVLMPQLSTKQRSQLTPDSPSENGLLVFDSTLKAYFYWNDGVWERLRIVEGPETSYLSIDPASFQHLKHTRELRHNNMIVFEADHTFVTVSRSRDGEVIMAPLDLPHGASLEEMTVYYMDNDGENIKVSLQKKSLTGYSKEVINWESSESSFTVRSQTFTNFSDDKIIDRQNNSYRLVVTFDLDNDDEVDEPSEARQRIYGVNIKYQK